MFGIVLAMGPGSDRKNGSVWFKTCPKTRRSASRRTKPDPVPISRQVSPGLARQVGLNLQFCVLGFSTSATTLISV